MHDAVMKSKKGFLGLPKKEGASYEKARAVIIPFGLESTVCYGRGTRKGPKAMIKASHALEFFDEQLWKESYKHIGIATLKAPDVPSVQEEALDRLEKIVESVLRDGKFPFVFGGEHAITAGAIRPFAARHPDLAILHFDAHADLRDGFEGHHYSHAAAMRRCLDHPGISLVSCGIRNISIEEIPFLDANRDRVRIYWAKDRKTWDPAEIASHLKGRPVYLTFDLDGFDSSLMPAVGTPEPGGMFWDDAIDIITAATDVCRVVGADINELAPIKGMHAPDFVAAKLAYRILGLAIRG
jgi:agmatinase